MAKEFKAYYDLWTNVDLWKRSYHGWLHDPLEEVNAGDVENTVDAAAKAIAGCVRFFRDKEDQRKILTIAEEMRTNIEEFKPEVPVLMALRTEGMKDRKKY